MNKKAINWVVVYAVFDILVTIFVAIAVAIILVNTLGCSRVETPTAPVVHLGATPTATPEVSVWLPDPDRMAPADPDSGKGRLQ